MAKKKANKKGHTIYFDKVTEKEILDEIGKERVPPAFSKMVEALVKEALDAKKFGVKPTNYNR